MSKLKTETERTVMYKTECTMPFEVILFICSSQVRSFIFIFVSICSLSYARFLAWTFLPSFLYPHTVTLRVNTIWSSVSPKTSHWWLWFSENKPQISFSVRYCCLSVYLCSRVSQTHYYLPRFYVEFQWPSNFCFFINVNVFPHHSLRDFCILLAKLAALLRRAQEVLITN